MILVNKIGGNLSLPDNISEWSIARLHSHGSFVFVCFNFFLFWCFGAISGQEEEEKKNWSEESIPSEESVIIS